MINVTKGQKGRPFPRDGMMISKGRQPTLTWWARVVGRSATRLIAWSSLVGWLTTASGLLAQTTNIPSAPAPATLAELRERISGLVSHPKFGAALWGVKVLSLDSGKTVFETNSARLFSPASNTKLYTVALALDRLGLDYRIRTSLYAAARPDSSGTVAGDVIVFGRGDPTRNARLHGGDLFAAVEPFVAALTNAGVRRIAGGLVGDASFFHGPEFGSGWDWDDQEYYYGAEISALTLNDNTLPLSVKPGAGVGAPGVLALTPPSSWLVLSNRTITVAKDAGRSIRCYRVPGENLVYVSGRIPLEDPGYTTDLTLHNPAGWFASFLKEALARRGISVAGQVRCATWLDRQAAPVDWDKMVELGGGESLPVRELAREVLKPSQNLYADLLLAQVGEQARAMAARSDVTSEALGISELGRFLSRAGVRRGDVHFEEGSGLSRNNLTTPNATVGLLQFMARHPAGEVFRQALPVAGVDGTLRNRMKGTPAAGNLAAKTGTLRWASSLSGYVTSAAGERLAFSLMLNRYANTDSERSTTAELDALAVLLAEWKGKSDEP